MGWPVGRRRSRLLAIESVRAVQPYLDLQFRFCRHVDGRYSLSLTHSLTHSFSRALSCARALADSFRSQLADVSGSRTC